MVLVQETARCCNGCILWALDSVLCFLNLRSTDYFDNSRDLALSSRPLTSLEVTQKRIELARMRYFDARAGRDIVVSCFLDSKEPWISQLWNWNEGVWNRFAVRISLLVHLGISFSEPESISVLQESGMPGSCIAVEILCILIELQDAFSKTFLLLKALPVRKKVVEPFYPNFMILILLDALLIWIFIDLILACSVRYSIQYVLPLKVFIVFLELKEVRYSLIFLVSKITNSV